MAKVAGVMSAEVDLALETAQVTATADNVSPQQLISAVIAAGFAASLIQDETASGVTTPTLSNKPQWRPVAVAALLSLPMAVAMLTQWLAWSLALFGVTNGAGDAGAVLARLAFLQSQ